MPEPPAYELDQRDGAVIARLTQAEVTHLAMQELCVELEEKIRYDNIQHFVIDLADVRFLPSACLGSMVEFVRELEHVRGRVALASCEENVAFLFKVTRLDAIFPIFDDVDEALDAAA